MRQVISNQTTISCQIVPLSIDTLDTVRSIVQDQAQYLHCGVDGVESMLERFLEQSNDELIPWLIVDQDNRPLAYAGLYKKPNHKVHSFMIVVNSELQGRGIGYKVASSLIEYIFKEGLCCHFCARSRLENQASLKLLTKIGMKVVSNTILDGYYYLEFELHKTDFDSEFQ